MLRAVKVATEAGRETILELGRPASTGLSIRGISGLGSGSTDLKLTDFAAIPGSTYSGERKPTRNIVFDIEIVGQTHRTIEEIRHATEYVFPLGEKVRLTFIADDRQCYIYGIVESNEPEIFSDDIGAGIECQVSIICYDPKFIDIQSTIISSFTTDRGGGYIFPVKKPSNMGIISDTHAIINIDYDGTKHEGIRFEFNFTTGAKVHRIRLSSRLSNNESNMLIQLLPKDEDTLFRNGDKLVIVTTQGEKSIKLYRNGQAYNYMNYLDSMEAIWCYLVHGNNKFNIIMNGGIGDAVKYSVDVSYLKTYWSI